MDEIFMTFKDQNYFLKYICFIFIHLANKAFQITVKTPDVVHFEFLPHPNRFYYTLPSKTPSGTWRKIRYALLGNSAHTYAQAPLKWVRRITYFVRVEVVMSISREALNKASCLRMLVYTSLLLFMFIKQFIRSCVERVKEV